MSGPQSFVVKFSKGFVGARCNYCRTEMTALMASLAKCRSCIVDHSVYLDGSVSWMIRSYSSDLLEI